MVVTTMQNPLGQTLVTQGHVQLDLLVHSIHVPRGTIVKLAALVQLVVIVALEPTIKVKKVNLLHGGSRVVYTGCLGIDPCYWYFFEYETNGTNLV